jgi:hypothetical protein
MSGTGAADPDRLRVFMPVKVDVGLAVAQE